jgi:hypothetical protein
MAQVKSNLLTSVAYDGVTGHRLERLARKVTLVPGVNDLTDAQADTLKSDRFFVKAVERGHFVMLDTAPVEAAEEVEAQADPRARLPGEKDKAYQKRMSALDQAAEAAATEAEKAEALRKTVADFMALDAETQTTLYETLSDEEKAAVDMERNPK